MPATSTRPDVPVPNPCPNPDPTRPGSTGTRLPYAPLRPVAQVSCHSLPTTLEPPPIRQTLPRRDLRRRRATLPASCLNALRATRPCFGLAGARIALNLPTLQAGATVIDRCESSASVLTAGIWAGRIDPSTSAKITTATAPLTIGTATHELHKRTNWIQRRATARSLIAKGLTACIAHGFRKSQLPVGSADTVGDGPPPAPQYARDVARTSQRIRVRESTQAGQVQKIQWRSHRLAHSSTSIPRPGDADGGASIAAATDGVELELHASASPMGASTRIVTGDLEQAANRMITPQLPVHVYHDPIDVKAAKWPSAANS